MPRKEHRVLPNKLKREFKQGMQGKVLLTDITYLFYGQGKKAYLSTINDASTHEILAYQVSDKITLNIALDTVKKLKKNRSVKLAEDAFNHSNQGFHYTNPKFGKACKKIQFRTIDVKTRELLGQCPQESFFGHFKDETKIKPCETLEELNKEIKSYMKYYNHYRHQWT